MLRICYKHWLSKTSNVLARLVVTAQVYAPWRKIGRMQVLFNKKLSFLFWVIHHQQSKHAFTRDGSSAFVFHYTTM